jgi:hypothetical protein
MARAGGLSRLGRTLYPNLHDRRLAEERRRAYAIIAAAAARVSTKQETAGSGNPTVSTTFDCVDGLSGCNSECA